MAKSAVIHVVGNRPQFIKLAVLYAAIEQYTSYPQYILHTGQHTAALMSDIFFKSLSIPRPDVQLNIRESSADEFIGKAATKIGEILATRSLNDLVLVYGDTNSTLAAAIATTRHGNKLIHFESGVRTNDLKMPEEINRILTDRMSSVHYCCTRRNLQQLKKEGFGTAIPATIKWTGDLMKDAFTRIEASAGPVIPSQEYVACTIHRAGNITHKKNLSSIVSALNTIHKEREVVIPLHPHTEMRLRSFGLQLRCTLLKPLDYRQMKRLMTDATLVITDSGGACREAYFAGKKSLIIMKYPFWPEIIEEGAALNCGADRQAILQSFRDLDDLQPAFDNHIFGKGDAAQKIARHLNSLMADQ